MKLLRLMMMALLVSGFLSACSTVKKDDMEGAASQDAGMHSSHIMEADMGNPYGLPGDIGEANLRSRAPVQITGKGYRIHFSYDSAMLSSEAMAALRANAAWLRSSGSSVTVEGHCDERGTREYNLALGQQRADAIGQFLIGQGVSRSQVKTISFGKERPVSLGHGEEAWFQNRRGEAIIR